MPNSEKTTMHNVQIQDRHRTLNVFSRIATHEDIERQLHYISREYNLSDAVMTALENDDRQLAGELRRNAYGRPDYDILDLYQNVLEAKKLLHQASPVFITIQKN